MRLRELLDPPCSLTPLTDEAALDRELRGVVTTDLPDPSRYLEGGELVVTGLIWRKEAADSEQFVAAAARSGASALAAGDAGDGDLPPDLLEACRKHRLPLLKVPGALAFAALTEYVVRRISDQRASDLGLVLERHRRLVAAPDPEQALRAILELISADLGMDCWVLDATGNAVAHSGAELSADEREALASSALSATGLPTRVTVPGKREKRSVFSIDDQDKITDWYLVLGGDWRQWDPQRRSVVDQVTDVLAAERRRLVERGAGWRADAERLVCDIAAGAIGAVGPDVAERIKALGCRAEDGTSYRVLALSGQAGTHRPDVSTARVLESAFEAQPTASRAAIAAFDEDPVSGLPAHIIVIAAGEPDARLRAWLDQVSPGLGARRVAIGVSSPAEAAQLKRAIDDARLALRVAGTRPEPVAFVGQKDIASHALLLASVPEDVRGMYCERMLGPILAYDKAHNSELEATLEAFLRASGSWIKCASAMHLHVNTLRYRISRIEELVGRSLSLLETQTDLLLALNLR